MFDIGFSELLIVAVVALIVLGPEKLPTAVRTVGLWVGKIRRSVASIQSEISEELRLDELRRQAAIEKDELERELNEMRQPYRNTTEQDRSSAFESAPEEDSSSKSESEKKGQDV